CPSPRSVLFDPRLPALFGAILAEQVRLRVSMPLDELPNPVWLRQPEESLPQPPATVLDPAIDAPPMRRAAGVQRMAAPERDLARRNAQRTHTREPIAHLFAALRIPEERRVVAGVGIGLPQAAESGGRAGGRPCLEIAARHDVDARTQPRD